MKNLKDILERKDDTTCTLPRWADFMRIGIDDETIDFFTVADLHEGQDFDHDPFDANQQQIEKLKVGESYYDKADNAVYVMLIDMNALKEK